MVKSRRDRGFSLVELLVVMGIIAVLISILLPAVSNAHRQALAISCKSNLMQNYMSMQAYSIANKDYFAPRKLGDDLPPDQRWTVKVFGRWNPPTMICPADEEPAFEHSFVLNDHALAAQVRTFTTKKGGKPVYQIILMGEKKSTETGYYMEIRKTGTSEYWDLIEKYRHGISLGSNYLWCDGHVDSLSPDQIAGLNDPWDIPAPQPDVPSTAPAEMPLP